MKYGNIVAVPMKFKRLLNLKDLLRRKSHFLFGPRATGKTTLVEDQLPGHPVYDLLDSEIFTTLVRRPKALSEFVQSREKEKWIIVDEIQKLPLLLDEVQRLISKEGFHFLLTGSSARKLKRGAANLLGGRAWVSHLFPLVTAEIDDFDLVKYINRGGLPAVYLASEPESELDAYISLYIREEIQAESAVRKLDQFVRFLDVMGLQNGKELHYQNISNDAGVAVRTVESYIGVLEDTLLGFQLLPFLATVSRKAISRSKFYFFDIGVAKQIAKIGDIRLGSETFGQFFEHFILLEIRAYLSYKRLKLPIQYWRSTSGFEVDCIIGSELALEIKSSDLVHEHHLKGLNALREEGKIKRYFVVSRDPRLREVSGIVIYPYLEFLKALWQGMLLNANGCSGVD